MHAASMVHDPHSEDGIAENTINVPNLRNKSRVKVSNNFSTSCVLNEQLISVAKPARTSPWYAVTPLPPPAPPPPPPPTPIEPTYNLVATVPRTSLIDDYLDDEFQDLVAEIEALEDKFESLNIPLMQYQIKEISKDVSEIKDIVVNKL